MSKMSNEADNGADGGTALRGEAVGIAPEPSPRTGRNGRPLLTIGAGGNVKVERLPTGHRARTTILASTIRGTGGCREFSPVLLRLF